MRNHAAQILYDNDLGRLYRYLKSYKGGRTTLQIKQAFPNICGVSTRLSGLRARLIWEIKNSEAVCVACFHNRPEGITCKTTCPVSDFNPVQCENLGYNGNGKRISRWSLDLPDGFEVTYADRIEVKT